MARQPLRTSSARRLRGWLPLLVAAWVAAAGCEGRPPPPNFLLLSIDTLRADHLGSYGYERNTSPHLDHFASRAIRFENAFAPTPWTLPSHVAMLTGRHPWEVGIVDYQSAIPADVTTLAEALSAAGYQTAALVDSDPEGLLGGRRGFARGFDLYRHAPLVPDALYRYDMAATVDAGLAWLEQRDRSRPFFLFLHTKSVHTAPEDRRLFAESDVPYHKPPAYRYRFLPDAHTRFRWSEGGDVKGVLYLRAQNERIAAGSLDPGSFSREQIDELIALYDGGVYYVDQHFARLVTGIAELGLHGDTVVAVTADHGEAFLDHRFFLHKELYAPLLRVPLILHDPRRPRAEIVAARVALADLPPTLLSLADLPAPAGMTGRPLPLGAGDAESPRPFFSYYRFDERHPYRAFSLREGSWKLVHHKLDAWPGYRTELYDLEADPEERQPLTGEAERERAMLGRLVEWIEAQPQGGAQRIELGADAIEHLRALGYLE